ncbi:MAG: GNAT family N-acetyltransferase [Marinilabiliaceae bacterium]|nr:GNAT family N-acetyltransferase [Marinilabiliaceae bacterium]
MELYQTTPFFATKVNRSEFDNQLSDFNHSVFLSSEWIESVAIHQSTPIYIHFYNIHNQLIAKLSGLLMPGSKRSGKYLYFYAGPALKQNHSPSYQGCIEALANFCLSEQFQRYHIDCSDHLSGIPCPPNGGTDMVYSEYVLFLEHAPKFGKSFRYNVNKATRNGAEFHHDNSPIILQKLFNLLDATRKIRYHKYGEKYAAFPFLHLNPHTMQRVVESGLAQLYYASVDNEIHCVRCTLEKNGRIFGLMIASDDIGYKLGLHHFMHYHLINQYYNQNAKYYNISGTADGQEGKGLSDFKASLGFSRVTEFGKDSLYLMFPRKLLNPLIKVKKKMTRKSS